MGKLVNVTQGGKTFAIPEEQIPEAIRQGFHVEEVEEASGRVVQQHREDSYGGTLCKVAATGLGVARTVSGGLSDVGLDAIGAGDDVRALREVNPGASVVGEIGGALLPTGVAGLASRAGARVARGVEGAGALTQIGRTARGAAVEGGIMGAGQGVSELALSDDPLDIENVASVLLSSSVGGAFAGGAVGAAGKVAEKGLLRARRALDDVASKGLGRAGEVTDDLAKLDRKGLRAAEKTEHEAIEAARVPRRAELADEIKSFRKELKDNKVWLATKGADDAEIRAIGKRTLKADRAPDNVLDDPKALAENPRAALSQLRKQEAALDELVTKHGDNLRAKFAGDASGDRVKALDYANVALEKNRALQTKIADVSAKPASERLSQIADAVEGLSAPKPQAGLASEMLGGSVFGHVAGAFSGLPIIGPMIGARAARAVQGLMTGKLGAASAEAAARGSKAIGSFLDVARKVAPAAPVVASKVLSSVRYAAAQDERRKTKIEKQRAPTMAESFKARADEVRAAVEPLPDGTVQTRRSTREQIAARLRPIAAVHPVMADRLESIAAARLEFLASKLPRRPDVGGMPIGPDKWQPSDMEMRTWARYVAAVEDPHGVVERLASGSITPEDVEAIQTVYPELHADITRQIVEQLPTLRTNLPYQRRLALSMFSGVPVDPALDPKVLRILQGSFTDEEGSERGTQAPMPQPAFGSVSKQEPTPAQQRGGRS